jgi:hypothetical protein
MLATVVPGWGVLVLMVARSDIHLHFLYCTWQRRRFHVFPSWMSPRHACWYVVTPCSLVYETIATVEYMWFPQFAVSDSFALWLGCTRGLDCESECPASQNPPVDWPGGREPLYFGDTE